MSVDRGLDIEAIELLDFDFAPPCEVYAGCDKTAEWRAVLKCCETVVLFCTPHKEIKVNHILVAEGWNCNRCKSILGPGSPFKSLDRI